jgi:hypothetical protein
VILLYKSCFKTIRRRKRNHSAFVLHQLQRRIISLRSPKQLAAAAAAAQAMHPFLILQAANSEGRHLSHAKGIRQRCQPLPSSAIETAAAKIASPFALPSPPPLHYFPGKFHAKIRPRALFFLKKGKYTEKTLKTGQRRSYLCAHAVLLRLCYRATS